MTSPASPPLWRDRQEAGCALGRLLAARGPLPSRALLLGLPRGGVVVAAALATVLPCPLRSWSVRKIADPSWPELAIGAIAGDDVSVWREGPAGPQQQRARRCGWLQREESELRRRQQLYGDPAAAELQDRPLIVVDDGIATGMTVLAALQALRRLNPTRLCLAVPVLDRQIRAQLEPLLDQLDALVVADGMRTVGEWYVHFAPVSDAEVLRLLSPQPDTAAAG
jgi:putative phosphoribosyl transferase